MVTHQSIVIICLLGGPRKSSFNLCSRIHTTDPTMRKKKAVTHHSFQVNGLKKAHALESDFLTGATTTSPDSIYGCVKSAILVLLVVIAISPTAASKVCREGKKLITQGKEWLTN